MNPSKKARIVLGILLTLLILLGFFVFIYNQANRLDDLSQYPVASQLEVLVLLAGLALLGSAGVWVLASFWRGRPKPFAYDIGLRLLLMGELVGFISCLADYIGMRAHHRLPYFGPLQTAGVILGEVLMAAGFLLMFPW
jgi:hypothetical protein